MKKYYICLLLTFGLTVNADGKASGKKMKYAQLTKEEESIIIHKGTEKPFSGKYNDHFLEGVYSCKRCSSPLFKSKSKFKSGCGWPSFDDAIQGKVKEIPDKDGHRTEIICASCSAHLGHVFRGEHFTPKNLRHCVNSVSLSFQEKADNQQYLEKAYFAAGCFWGVEYFFKTAKGVINVDSGYIGGQTTNPTYKEVSSGSTDHAEAVEVVFDTRITNFETLGKLFFEIHDQSQINRQGPDIGSQYRSEIFYTNKKQKETALTLIQFLKDQGLHVATKVTKASPFYKAENYHQDYYEKNGKEPYCHFRTNKFK